MNNASRSLGSDLPCCYTQSRPLQPRVIWQPQFEGMPSHFTRYATEVQVAPPDRRLLNPDLNAAWYARSSRTGAQANFYQHLNNRQMLCQMISVNPWRYEPSLAFRNDRYSRPLQTLQDAWPVVKAKECPQLPPFGPCSTCRA